MAVKSTAALSKSPPLAQAQVRAAGAEVAAMTALNHALGALMAHLLCANRSILALVFNAKLDATGRDLTGLAERLPGLSQRARRALEIYSAAYAKLDRLLQTLGAVQSAVGCNCPPTARGLEICRPVAGCVRAKQAARHMGEAVKHVRATLDVVAIRLKSDPPEACRRFAARVCRLQALQLEGARVEFSREMGAICGAFGQRAQINAAIEAVAMATADMQDRATQLLGVVAEVTISCADAMLKAPGLEGLGAEFSAASDDLRVCSDGVANGLREVPQALDRVLACARRLGRTDDAIEAFGASGGEMTVALDRLRGDTGAILERLEGGSPTLEELDDICGALGRAATELGALASGPGDEASRSAELDGQIDRQFRPTYTLQSERSIHDRFTGYLENSASRGLRRPRPSTDETFGRPMSGLRSGVRAKSRGRPSA